MKNFILYVSCSPIHCKNDKSWESLLRNLLNTSKFLEIDTNMGNSHNRLFVLSSQSKQSELENLLLNWSKTVRFPYFFIAPLSDSFEDFSIFNSEWMTPETFSTELEAVQNELRERLMD